MPDVFKKIKSITSFPALQDFILTSSSKTLKFAMRRPTLRKLAFKYLEIYLKNLLMSDIRFSKQMQEDKFYMFKSLMISIDRLIENSKGKDYENALVKKVIPNIVKVMKRTKNARESFKKKYGIYPPAFLTISPGKFCNLKCTGCYANSDSAAGEKLDFKTVDKIVREKTRDWGSFFTVISGGEPFAWKDNGKGLLELAEKHPDNFFLVYTNSTLITPEVAKKLAKLGNVTPAISIEGYEKETDKRRGKGVYAKIISAMESLKKEGIFFGISVTATKENAKLISSDEFMDFYFKKMGISYCWMFQLMPIGRAGIDMMVTPLQRLKMFRNVLHLIKDKNYFIADFWNCGSITAGCISACKTNGGGYLYVEWNGNITPCVFNPYAVGNINDMYSKGESLNKALISDFFKSIRKWQHEYGFARKKDEYGNWILPCPMKDHYADMKKMITSCKVKPIDEYAAKAIKDPKYLNDLKKFDKEQEKLLNPVWEKEYLEK